MQIVNDPRDVIDFLRKKENRYVFGEGRTITHRFFGKSRHGCCVQLRQFFRTYDNNGVTLHYEIEEYGGGIGVEIHSEPETPQIVHNFIRKQFSKNHQLESKGKGDASYRFATHIIVWQGRVLDEVITDIKIAVDALYRTYDAYLNYVEGYYVGKGAINGCKSYDEFMRGITA